MLTIETIKIAVHPLAEKYRVRKMQLFGSYATGRATGASDADFLVEFMVEVPTLLDVFGLQDELAHSLQIPVDIVALPLARPDRLQLERMVTVYERTR